MDAPALPVVQARGLEKRITGPSGTLDILRSIDLDVFSGESLAILGASGSGKSTLLGLLAGLDAPTAGKVQLLGQEISRLNEDGRAELRAGRIGFVFQSFQLLPSLTAVENVLMPLELNLAHADLPTSELQQRAMEALTTVGLANRAKHYPYQLSGGEQQRVAIARAIVDQPAVLFADEPTGNLDAETGCRIMDLLFSLAVPKQGTATESTQTALVLVTHDPELAKRCDRVIHIRDGLIA